MSTRGVLGISFVLLVTNPGLAFGQAKPKSSYPRDLITREEIREKVPGARDALQVVQQLRPHFLRERTSGTAQRDPVRVYIDGVRSALSTAALRDIRAEDVVDLRYLNPSDATTRFGTGHINGAILVATGK